MTQLHVVHVSESDGSGGAAKSARSLHDGLKRRGIDSRMLVGRKLGDDPDVRPLKRNVLWRVLDAPFARLLDGADLQYAFYPSSFGVARDSWFRRADVLQLHNLHGNFFSFSAIPFLSLRRATVWWIQDMWPVTGHVAYSYDCERWRHGCGACPYLGEYPALRRDRTRTLWRLKRAAYARSRLTIVTSSRWLQSVVAESPLLGRFERRLIPNGVDLDRFRPRSKEEARARLGVEPGRPVVLLFDGEPRKGAAMVPEVVARLAAAAASATLLVAGERGAWPAPEPLAVRELGRFADEELLADVYAAADVFALPTLADNLPNAVLECLASGVPVVGTRVGGVPDAVRHLQTGYLARPGSAEDVAAGIELLLRDDELRARLAAGARETAEREYGDALQAERFAELYAEVAA